MSFRRVLMIAALLNVFGATAGAAVGDTAKTRGVLGTERGAGALGQSSAAAGMAEGFSLRLYQMDAATELEWGEFGVQTLLPFGPISFQYSSDWMAWQGKRRRSDSVGVSLRLGESSSFGISRRMYPGDVESWTASYYTEFDRWLTMVLMADDFNAPDLGELQMPRRYRAGWGVKPLYRSYAWTLGAEFELEEELDGSLDASEVSFSSRLPLWSGFAWDLVYRWEIGGKSQLWTGLDIALNIDDSQSQARIYTELSRLRTDATGNPRYGSSFTIGGVDREAIDVGPNTVGVTLRGDLRRESQSFFGVPQTVSQALWDLHRLSDQTRSWDIVVDIGPLNVGMATAEEVANALEVLKRRGKTVRARLGQAAEKEMLAASAASSVNLDPYATIEMDGFASSRSFYRTLLARFGIEFETLGVGEYKTAPDTYTRDSARLEDIQVRSEIVETFDDVLVQRVSMGRELKRETVADALDRGYLLPLEAVEAKFVDGLTFPDEAKALPKELESYSDFRGPLRGPTHWGSTPRVAVVELNGNMTMSSTGDGLMGTSMSAVKTVETLEALRKDDRVKAVVLRVDSPGGSVQAAEEMWRSARRLADRKPLIVSMGDVAASGGYYVATAAHRILALPTTVTGSIGIFLIRPNAEELYERLEIGRDVQKSREHADRGSLSRAWTPAVKVKVQTALEHYYRKFIERVALARGLEFERADALGRGRVYTGRRALELGLVDAHGGVVDAIMEAANMAGLERGEYDVTFSDPSGGWAPPSLGLGLLKGLHHDMESTAREALIGAFNAELEWITMPLARLPFEYGDF